ncbi:MAG: hypothetical protein IIB77_12850, partial [Proteobacteria bacterium]|nr:hypothetical protein [Pseudomonadota bacterium]
SGFVAISEAQALLDEAQKLSGERYMVLNTRDSKLYAQDLAARQTVQGRPEDAWATGQIGQNISEYDVFVGSFLPTLAGGPDPATTLTASVDFAIHFSLYRV